MWRINWATVEAFLAIATQWDQLVLPDGRVLWTGLDYARARAGWKNAGLTVPPATWRGVQAMEREAARVLNGGA